MRNEVAVFTFTYVLAAWGGGEGAGIVVNRAAA